MKISVLTLFPQLYDVLSHSIPGRGMKSGKFSLDVHNIRDYSQDKHKKTDDAPFGGGAGMVMTPQPLHSAITSLDPDHTALRVYLTPKGEVLDQQRVRELAGASHLMLINGSYEGVDQRVIDLDVDVELSIGDYVLTCGDYASLVLIDAVVRYVPGVLGCDESTREESFTADLLEYPHYTRPQEFEGLRVPEVLVGGDHAKVAAWRLEQAQALTKARRPDLYQRYLARTKGEE